MKWKYLTIKNNHSLVGLKEGEWCVTGMRESENLYIVNLYSTLTYQTITFLLSRDGYHNEGEWWYTVSVSGNANNHMVSSRFLNRRENLLQQFIEMIKTITL